MMLFLFQTKGNKILFRPPPPPKKRLRDTNGRDNGCTHKCLSVPAARDLNIYYVEIE